ncbi:MAG: radical SAM protein [Nitrospirota bacterium]
MNKRLTKEKALRLFRESGLLEIGEAADNARKALHPEGPVTFVVDRNINYTNVCINRCTFCAFYRDSNSKDAYLLDNEEIFRKIDETVALGGTQILIQGGLNPALDIGYYTGLLRAVKGRYDINIHGFSPPEIHYLADRHNLTIRETIRILKDAGLDSIPGGGAEILSDRIRAVLSPRKIKTRQWLKVMEDAHRLGMRTTATMMFGSIEGPEDIIEHLEAIRALQDRTGGFTAFIPWSFQPGNTALVRSSVAKGDSPRREFGVRSSNNNHEPRTTNSELKIATAVDYLRVLALSRLYLDNIKNIQASWVTQGLKLAQVSLRFGANDFGSTMIEENVVASAGVSYSVTKDDIIKAIKSAGFKPAQRDTYYNIIKEF